MHWLVRDFLIVVACTLAGASAGACCLLVELAGLWVIRGVSRDAPSLAWTRYQVAWLIVIGIWAIACGASTIYVVHRVHWMARQLMIDTREWDLRFWFLVLPVWICGFAILVQQSFAIARNELGRGPAIGMTCFCAFVNAGAFVVVILVLGVIAHFAAGGIE